MPRHRPAHHAKADKGDMWLITHGSGAYRLRATVPTLRGKEIRALTIALASSSA
jgi:hypothetical protein